MRMEHGDREGHGRRGERHGDRHGERHGRQGSRGGRGGHESGGGAQTFRRGRILLFLEQLKIKRATIARQLGQAEFDSIRPMLAGELKALDQVIEEYIHIFDLQEMGDDPDVRGTGDGGEGNS